MTSAAIVDQVLRHFLADVTAHPGSEADIWGRQFDAGLAWVDFPPGLGGLGAARGLRGHVETTLAAAGIRDSGSVNGIGVTLAAPVLLIHGSPDQLSRYLRPLFTGEEIWCQLFSEPGAGSDLAGLATRAVRTEDAWVIDGQKVWTTLGHRAHRGLLCARTDPDAPKHAGLSMFIMDMGVPGVEVRPIREITGDADFNEVFFTGARIPLDAIIGEPGTGWSSITATLANERAGFAGTPLRRGEGPIGELTAIWSAHGAERPELRDRYLRLWVRAEAIRLAEASAIAAEDAGVPSAAWSSLKVLRSELDQQIYSLSVSLLGVAGLEYASYEMHQPQTLAEVSRVGDVQRSFLFARCSTIAGGTSEVQRTIVADRVLRLPREPQNDRGLPWRKLRRS
jgi:alkylation response protein AidB-like acyl-CoA dehydrogenase